MVDLCRQTKGAVFVTAPSQNIDRIMSIYRAARQAGRKFIIDLYSAELFDRLKNYSDEIPQPSCPDVLLWYPWIQQQNLLNQGLGWVKRKHQRWRKPLKELSAEIPHSVMILRPPFRKQIKNNADLSGSVWVYSMWRGYLERTVPLQKLKQWVDENGIPSVFRHTSGHAQIRDLKRLAKALSPEVLIPIHSYHGELFSDFFANVRCLADKEEFEA
jgi:ribonuclease J